MSLRIDKYFIRDAEARRSIQQCLSNLTIDNTKIPALDLGASFTYLGKMFNFEIDNAEVKTQLVSRLSKFLEIISNLNIKVQLKLKILKSYVPSQLNFDLRIYDLSYTWIGQNLDAIIINTVINWIELSNGSKLFQLPTNQGGYGIPSLKMTAQKLRLSLRNVLKHNDSTDLRNIWKLSSRNNIPLDSQLLEREPTKSLAKPPDHGR